MYSPSIWAGWYRGIYTEYKSVTEEEFNKVDHFLHMEWGGDSHAGRHSERPDKALQQVKAQGAADERAGDASLYGGAARVAKDGDWSESYICNLFDWHLTSDLDEAGPEGKRLITRPEGTSQMPTRISEVMKMGEFV